MSGESSDYLFQNYEAIITIDFNRLKLMIGELYKTQKQHANTILDIMAVVYDTSKQDEVFRRLGLLENKSDSYTTTVQHIQQKVVEIEGSIWGNDQNFKKEITSLKENQESNLAKFTST